jgi:hypothetical protein
MADRDRFGGSERDYLPVGKAAQRHEVNHQGYSPPWRDTRFGGNMERANTGIPYPTGGRDVRFEGSLPHKFSYLDNGRSVTSDVEPYWTDMGRNWSVPIPQSRTGTPNFRGPDMGSGAYLSNQFGRGDDGGGLESLESKIDLNDIFNRFPGMNLWKLIKQLDKRGIEYAGNDTGIGSTDVYQMAELTQGQKDYMRNPLFSPGLESAPSADELFRRVKEREEKPGYWWNPLGSEGQEPTTREEFDEYYNDLQGSFYA